MKNKTGLLLLLILIITNCGFAQENRTKESVSNEEKSFLELPQIQVIPIRDTQAGRNYELYIKLPKNYAENPDTKYPVIYFTDAMWHVEILSASTEYMLEDVILVGISWQKDINAELRKERGEHVSRFRDYSISKSNKPEIQAKYQLGQAHKHLGFIRNDVIKYIDKNYRTDADSRTYFGYSLGGEFGAYILLTQPETFDNYIIGSPSIKSEVSYLSELNSKFGPFDTSNRNTSLNANVFISHGTLEKEMVEPIEAFIGLLNDRRDDGLAVQSEVIEGTHQTAFPMTAVRSVAWLSTLIDHASRTNPEHSFFDIPQLNKAFINPKPEDRKDELVVGELGVDGGNKDKIIKLAQEIAEGKHDRYDSFLIDYKGKLIFESYYARGRINLPHPQASATKTYTSMVLGRAIQLGYLSMADLDKPVIGFLKDLDPSTFVAGADKITLNQALTMRSGIRIKDEQTEAFQKNPNQIQGQGLIQTLLEQSAPITEASQSPFSYGNYSSHLVMQVIDAVVPGSAKDFIKHELLDKMGITNFGWQPGMSGLPAAGWKSSMTSRDMIKFGTLAMNKGKWKGEQLVSEAFIAKASSRILYTSDEDVFGGGKDVSKQGYGYFWWSADLTYDNKSYFCASAQGGGGQYIILIEELDLMMVITAHENENSTLQMIAERVIPAFIEE